MITGILWVLAVMAVISFGTWSHTGNDGFLIPTVLACVGLILVAIMGRRL